MCLNCITIIYIGNCKNYQFNFRKLKIWSKEYQIPRHTLSQTSLVKLDQKQKLDKKDKKDILSGIYTDVTTYDGGL